MDLKDRATLYKHQFAILNEIAKQYSRQSNEYAALRAAEIALWCVLSEPDEDFTKQLDKWNRGELSPEQLAELRPPSELKQLRSDLGERLMNIQETERSRIARELHDDIGQSLAILGAQLERAGRPISDRPGKRHMTALELAQRVHDIASRVSRLSHQLHSSQLEHLGLSKALRGECSEFSHAQRMEVDFSFSAVPDGVDNTIGLSLLRVVQEALHNISKHSRATQVKVQLTANDDVLHLIVADNGVGFDVEQARLANGIGLISMSERINLVGGKFEITSKSGEGTLIQARVPLRNEQEKAV